MITQRYELYCKDYLFYIFKIALLEYNLYIIEFHFLCLFYLFTYGRNVRLVASYFPDQGLHQWPLQWKARILTTGLPGKSLHF